MAARRQPSSKARKLGKTDGSPLDDRQRKLLEEQEQLKQRVEQLNRVIADAPRIKEERSRAQRDQLLVERSTRGQFRLNSATLTDTRYDEFASRASGRARRRPLKAERRQARMFFLCLLVLLGFLVFWLLSVWHWQWPG